MLIWSAAVLALLCPAGASAGEDAYEHYVRTSEDFTPVNQDKAWCLKAFPAWTYMPWTARWTIGYTESSGWWSVAHGYNGAFVDRDDVAAGPSRTGRLDWIDRFGLRFYVDHAAGKGNLHLWDGDPPAKYRDALHGRGTRTVPLNNALAEKLEKLIRRKVAAAMRSPHRAAYALDDEISWGHFVHPAMWHVTDDAAAYPAWLREIYGAAAP